MKSDVTVLKVATGSSKRDAEEKLNQESSKRQKIDESSHQAKEPRDKEPNELSQKELQQMMIIVSEEGMHVEALQTKYLIIDWEIYTEDTRKERNRHLHAGRKGVSTVKRSSYTDAGSKALSGIRQ
ncbi:hypothetical protein Tco_0205410 [Tanacetum coccineum]